MSAYKNYTTEFKDKQCLVEALNAVGYTKVETHEKPETLVDYVGKKRPDQAEIIVRRRQIGPAANDLGFRLQPDGTYKAIISDYDRGKHNDRWLSRLRKEYNIRYASQYAKAKGMTFVRQEQVADPENKGQFTTKMIFRTQSRS